MAWYFWALLLVVVIIMVVVLALYVFNSKGGDNDLRVAFVPERAASVRRRRAMYGADVDRKTLVIEELHYYLTGITMSEDMTLTGTAWSDPVGTMNLMEHAMSEQEYDAFGYDEGVADTTNYIDMMSPASQAKLQIKTSVSSAGGNGYRFMFVNWARPFKVRATAYAADGITPVMSTKAGVRNEDLSNGNNYGFAMQTVSDKPLTAEGSELATVVANNGGSIIRLFEPVKIEPGVPKVLYLLFDPLQTIRAGGPTPDDGMPHSLLGADRMYFDTGIISVVPVLARPTDKIMRERYRIRLNEASELRNPGQSTGFDMILQVYTLESAPDVVSAVTIGSLALEGESLLPEGAPFQLGLVFYIDRDTTTGLYSFNQHDESSIVSGFARGADDGTCSVRCFYGLCGSKQVQQDHGRMMEGVRVQFIDEVQLDTPALSVEESPAPTGLTA